MKNPALERIKSPVVKRIAAECTVTHIGDFGMVVEGGVDLEKFAQEIVSKTLKEVADRAYYCGDRSWSDELDRQWIELEFGFGNLTK